MTLKMGSKLMIMQHSHFYRWNERNSKMQIAVGSDGESRHTEKDLVNNSSDARIRSGDLEEWQCYKQE